jgi:hypothetical protein
MKRFVRKAFGNLPFLKSLYCRYLAWRTNVEMSEGQTRLNIPKVFPEFAANSWGRYEPRARLTLKSISQTVPAIYQLAAEVGDRVLSTSTFQAFAEAGAEANDVALLKKYFDLHGSDKASRHDYYVVYASLLGDRNEVAKVFEIGLGTNYTDVVSTMGKGGHPGASLRAFRDYCPNAMIYGADFDRRILFDEDRIRTFFVDQTESETFSPLGDWIGSDFDLMIDDGLHAPDANLHSLTFFLPRIRVGGWAVVEDISPASESIWRLVASILPSRYECHLLVGGGILMFLVKRLA